LLFENVKGSAYPLAINIFGSEERIELALGCPPAQLGQELAALAQSVQPPKWMGLWRSRATLKRVLGMRTASAWGTPRSQKIVEEPALEQLPILKCWPKDAARFITFGLVITQHPLTKVRNVGLY